jgi:hypothetical protein
MFYVRNVRWCCVEGVVKDQVLLCGSWPWEALAKKACTAVNITVAANWTGKRQA